MCYVVIFVIFLMSVGESGAIGRLYGRIPNWENSPVFNLRIKSFNVTVTIQDQLAITHIDEVFANDSWRRLEGIYILELPEGAKLTEMYLWINGERFEQEIRRREDAVEIFEEIVRRRTDPLLAEEIGENVFRFRLFPIDGFSERRIEIKYIHLLPYDSGEITYRFPMDVADFEEDPIEQGALNIHLSSQFQFASVLTPSYPDPPANTITEISPTEYEIEFGNENFIPDRNYDLVFRVNRDRIYHVLTFAPPDPTMEDGFYLLWVTPPDSIFKDTAGAQNVVLVADVSSSMEGTRLHVLKEALQYFVQQLQPGDRFNLVTFSTGVSQFRPDLVAATQANLQAASDYVSGLAALGLTNLDAALTTALNQTFDITARSSIILITDGMPNRGVTEPNTLLSNIRANNSSDVSIFPVGIGQDVDTNLLNAIASENSGFVFLESEESLIGRLPQIYKRMTSPILRDISLAYHPLVTYDRYPLEFDNLASGRQLVHVGRFPSAPTFDLTLSGMLGDQPVSFLETVAFPDNSTNHYVSRVWAAKKINFLLEQIEQFGEVDELVEAVINLSIKYSVLSPFTAFLIIEPGEGAPITDVEHPLEGSVPESFALFQNYPNPFNPETSITYHVALSKECDACLVSLKIYNILGELVKVLVQESQAPGEYTVVWDGRDEQGNLVPSGIYVTSLEVGDFVATRRMLLLK